MRFLCAFYAPLCAFYKRFRSDYLSITEEVKTMEQTEIDALQASFTVREFGVSATLVSIAVEPETGDAYVALDHNNPNVFRLSVKVLCAGATTCRFTSTWFNSGFAVQGVTSMGFGNWAKPSLMLMGENKCEVKFFDESGVVVKKVTLTLFVA